MSPSCHINWNARNIFLLLLSTMWNSHDILEQFQIEIVPKIDTGISKIRSLALRHRLIWVCTSSGNCKKPRTASCDSNYLDNISKLGELRKRSLYTCLPPSLSLCVLRSIDTTKWQMTSGKRRKTHNEIDTCNRGVRKFVDKSEWGLNGE